DVIAMGKDRVPVFGNADAAEVGGKAGEVGHLDAADVFRVAGVVAVANHAIGGAANLSGDVAEVRRKSLPLGRNVRGSFGGVALTQSRNKQCLEVLETRWFESCQ